MISCSHSGISATCAVRPNQHWELGEQVVPAGVAAQAKVGVPHGQVVALAAEAVAEEEALAAAAILEVAGAKALEVGGV